MQEADMGFAIVVDRRNDKWTSVKAVLSKISVRKSLNPFLTFTHMTKAPIEGFLIVYSTFSYALISLYCYMKLYIFLAFIPKMCSYLPGVSEFAHVL